MDNEYDKDRFGKVRRTFKTPENYFQNLPDLIMEQLPPLQEKETVEPKVIKLSLIDKARPWIYLAAVFAGLALFFKGIVIPMTGIQKETVHIAETVETEDNVLTEEDYIAHLEDLYAEQQMDAYLFDAE